MRRVNSPFYSRPYPGWSPTAGYNQPGPMIFGYNPNINHGTRWRGKLSKIPRPASTVIMAEFNNGGSSVNPGVTADFQEDVNTRYRVSRPGKKAIYLYADFHVEALQGDRGYQYYKSHPEETNIWRWW
jgi:prepilin-type processing-associated H-X9-DG protein